MPLTQHEHEVVYEPPMLIEYGALEEVTAGAGTPGPLDRTFPTGTPFADLTFTT